MKENTFSLTPLLKSVVGFSLGVISAFIAKTATATPTPAPERQPVFPEVIVGPEGEPPAIPEIWPWEEDRTDGLIRSKLPENALLKPASFKPVVIVYDRHANYSPNDTFLRSHMYGVGSLVIQAGKFYNYVMVDRAKVNRDELIEIIKNLHSLNNKVVAVNISSDFTQNDFVGFCNIIGYKDCIENPNQKLMPEQKEELRKVIRDLPLEEMEKRLSNLPDSKLDDLFTDTKKTTLSRDKKIKFQVETLNQLKSDVHLFEYTDKENILISKSGGNIFYGSAKEQYKSAYPQSRPFTVTHILNEDKSLIVGESFKGQSSGDHIYYNPHNNVVVPRISLENQKNSSKIILQNGKVVVQAEYTNSFLSRIENKESEINNYPVSAEEKEAHNKIPIANYGELNKIASFFREFETEKQKSVEEIIQNNFTENNFKRKVYIGDLGQVGNPDTPMKTRYELLKLINPNTSVLYAGESYKDHYVIFDPNKYSNVVYGRNNKYNIEIAPGGLVIQNTSTMPGSSFAAPQVLSVLLRQAELKYEALVDQSKGLPTPEFLKSIIQSEARKISEYCPNPHPKPLPSQESSQGMCTAEDLNIIRNYRGAER